jgi:hypothetical protein
MGFRSTELEQGEPGSGVKGLNLPAGLLPARKQHRNFFTIGGLAGEGHRKGLRPKQAGSTGNARPPDVEQARGSGGDKACKVVRQRFEHRKLLEQVGLCSRYG